MKKISIVIPTYNAGLLLQDVLKSIFEQDFKPLEVIIIDSSSTDETPALARSFPTLFHSIQKKDFGHGKTRNYGAKLAKGDYIVFLTQDAVPRNNHWLSELIKDLDSKKIAGAFSRQIARDHAVPMEKFFYSQMYPNEARDFSVDHATSQDILFSNASSAVRKSFILQFPFAEDILMSEDLEWAMRVLRSGYTIAYEAASQVTHSHNTSFNMLFKRYFDFGVSHDEIKAKETGSSYLGKGLSTALREFKYLAASRNAVWIPRSVAYNSAKFLGLTFGRNNRLLPRALKRQFTSYYKEYWP